MKIRFNEIPAEGLFLEITDQSWFPDREVFRTGPLHASVHLQTKGQERILLTGEIATTLTLDCDRCLEAFQKELAAKFAVDLELLENDRHQPVEHGCSHEEMDTMFLLKPEIDVYQILYQQVLLSLPEKRVCTRGCRGLCPQCGVNLNEKECRCQREVKSSPFGVLAGMKGE